MVGSLGTIGLIAEVILRTNPVPAVSMWLESTDADPFAAHALLRKASAVLWDGRRTWIELEGHGPDVEAERRALNARRVMGRDDRSAGAAVRAMVVATRPSFVARWTRRLHDTGPFVASDRCRHGVRVEAQAARTIPTALRETSAPG